MSFHKYKIKYFPISCTPFIPGSTGIQSKWICISYISMIAVWDDKNPAKSSRCHHACRSGSRRTYATRSCPQPIRAQYDAHTHTHDDDSQDETQKNVLNLWVRWPKIIAVNWFCCFCCSHSLLCVIPFSLLSFFRQCDHRGRTAHIHSLTAIVDCRCCVGSSIVVVVTNSRHFGTRPSASIVCLVWLQRGRVYLWMREPFHCYRAAARIYVMDLLSDSPARMPHSRVYLTHFHLISGYHCNGVRCNLLIRKEKKRRKNISTLDVCLQFYIFRPKKKSFTSDRCRRRGCHHTHWDHSVLRCSVLAFLGDSQLFIFPQNLFTSQNNSFASLATLNGCGSGCAHWVHTTHVNNHKFWWRITTFSSMTMCQLPIGVKWHSLFIAVRLRRKHVLFANKFAKNSQDADGRCWYWHSSGMHSANFLFERSGIFCREQRSTICTYWRQEYLNRRMSPELKSLSTAENPPMILSNQLSSNESAKDDPSNTKDMATKYDCAWICSRYQATRRCNRIALSSHRMTNECHC